MIKHQQGRCLGGGPFCVEQAPIGGRPALVKWQAMPSFAELLRNGELE